MLLRRINHWMGKFLAVVAVSSSLACALAADAVAGTPVHKADGKLGDWRGKPTMIAGRTTTSRGEYIYTDWLYDDYGPDLDGNVNQTAFRSQLSPTRGDYRYPDDPARYGYNAADLRELRVAADGKTLHLLIALQTMKVANAAIVQVAIDCDGLDRTPVKGGGRWPDGSGITTKGPGHFVTTTGNSAHLTTPAGRRSVKSVANTAANAIEVDVPLSALNSLAKRPRIWVVTGLNDGHGRFKEQESGATAVFNAGFRRFEHYPTAGADPTRFTDGGWNDARQASALAAGDLSAFGGSFDVGRLQRGESDKTKPLAPGRYVRIFRSAKNYGEGIDLKTEQSNVGGNPDPEFKSRYQPYALYIPKGYDPRKPSVFTLNGHSLDVSHLEYFTVAPNQQRQLGDERRSIIVTPLSRGTDTWFIDAGLIDTIEAWNDARRHYKIDDRRTFITGYSMGGYMTYRLGLLMPDRFAKASVYVGPPAYQLWPYPAPPVPDDKYGAIGNTNNLVENAFDLPYEINHGNSDELVPVAGVQHQADTFQQAGNAYVFYRHSSNDHFSFILNDEWSHTRDFLGTKPLNENPIEVRYRRYPAVDLPRDGVRFDSAYWISGIRVRGNQKDPANSGSVDAVTHGLGGHLAKPVEQLPQPVAGPVSPGTKYEQRQLAGKAIAKANALDVKLAGVTGAAIDLRRIGLTLKKNLKLHLENDAPLDLILRGPYGKVNVVGGTLSTTKGGVVLHVTPGKRDLTLVAG
jgi:pimeloyl-ACP methyl ester carboxylesterase